VRNAAVAGGLAASASAAATAANRAKAAPVVYRLSDGIPEIIHFAVKRANRTGAGQAKRWNR